MSVAPIAPIALPTGSEVAAPRRVGDGAAFGDVLGDAIASARATEATATDLVARFAAGEDVRDATATLNRVLCIAGGIRIHALAPRRRSLETLYRNAAKLAEPAALA